MLASLLVSVLLVGFKLNAVKELVQTHERRKELKANLLLLVRMWEDENKAAWIADITHDAEQRKSRIAVLDSASGGLYSAMEEEAIGKGPAMFAKYESSSAGVKQLERSASVDRAETRLDGLTGLVLGLAEAVVATTPQEIIAYCLHYDSRHLRATLKPTVNIRAEPLETVNGHHTIIFNRLRAAGISDRTFINSIIAKRVAEDPPTYLMVVLPIPSHGAITRQDEARAVRAEFSRCFRLTEMASGRTSVQYVCSLDLRGFVPQSVTSMFHPLQPSPAPQLRMRS